MQFPSPDKFVYSLFQLPSTFAKDNDYDQQLFHKTAIAIVRIHKKWLRQNPNAPHSCLCTSYGLTSGELAILYYRRSN